MEKNCSTCVHRNDPDNTCRKGDKAELYCMGGDFELWAGDMGGVLDAEIVDGEDSSKLDVIKIATERGVLSAQAENEKVFTMPEQPYADKLSGDVINDMRFIADRDSDAMENEIGREFSEEEKKAFDEIKANAEHYLQMLADGRITEDQLKEHFTAVQSFSESLKNRPKTPEEGYNGVKKTTEIKSYSCKDCKHHSNVGCFLGRYYDCVDAGRYLYEGVGTEKQIPLEKREELESDENDIRFIDSLLEDRDRRKQ